MKRSLVLGGGGAKIGWASGALEVMLDEARLEFDHIDATSGSVFNLAMLLSGKTAGFIAQAWADLSPREFMSFHPLWKYLTPWRLPSLLTQEAARTHVLPKWGIDPERIRACTEVYGRPIEAVNRQVEDGTAKPGRRKITVHVIQPEGPVPVDYLYFKSKRQMRPVIQTGRESTRLRLAATGHL